MATKRGNPEDQESSIKSRANEVFSEANDSVPIKSFEEYLKSTPATPLSFELRALLWVVAFMVAILFLGALLRVQRGGRRPRVPRPPARISWARHQAKRSIRGAESLVLSSPRMDLGDRPGIMRIGRG